MMEKTQYRYVIVGGGLAGGKACQGIREEDPEGSIVLISEEDHPPYHRPPLSKGFLKNEAGLEKVYLQGEDNFQEMDVDLILGQAVTAISTDENSITMENGVKIEYHKLLLATGGRAISLPLWGSDLDQMFTLRTIEDSRAIKQAAGEASRALVMGGSFIGAEVAASLAQMGLEVIEIFPEDRLLEHVVPEELSQFLEERFSKNKIRVLSNTVAEGLEGEQSVQRVALDNGEHIPVDFVVMGVGIKLNSELAVEAGLEVDDEDGSVVVDSFLKTSDQDIYAAGDLTVWPDPRSENMIHAEHWDVARQQGLTAGRNLGGGKLKYSSLPYFFSDVLDLSFEVWGTLDGWDETVRRGKLEDGSAAYFYFRDGQLTGVLAVNRPEGEREAMKTLPAGGPAYHRVAEKLRDETFDLQQLIS